MFIRVSVSDLDQYIGYYVSSSVCDPKTGNILLAVNYKLSSKMVVRLQNLKGILSVELSKNKLDKDELLRESEELIHGKEVIQTRCILGSAFNEIMGNGNSDPRFSSLQDGLSNNQINRITESISSLQEAIEENPTSTLYINLLKSTGNYLLDHSINVAYLSLCLASTLDVRNIIRDKEWGISKFDISSRVNLSRSLVSVGISGLLHDIGKMSIKEVVDINCRYKKESDEWELIKTHPKISHDMLFGHNIDAHVLLGVKYHHENFDGTGYAYGVCGSRIHIFARILRICDSYDAATSVRPGQEHIKDKDEILDELLLMSETHYDPELVKIFVGLLR